MLIHVQNLSTIICFIILQLCCHSLSASGCPQKELQLLTTTLINTYIARIPKETLTILKDFGQCFMFPQSGVNIKNIKICTLNLYFPLSPKIKWLRIILVNLIQKIGNKFNMNLISLIYESIKNIIRNVKWVFHLLLQFKHISIQELYWFI